MRPGPTAVDLDRSSQVLTITWEDGSVGRLPGRQVRWACPCAHCRGEMGTSGDLERYPGPESLAEPDSRISEVTLVGRYALRIGFESGHATGIYTFDRLRDLCGAQR